MGFVYTQIGSPPPPPTSSEQTLFFNDFMEATIQGFLQTTFGTPNGTITNNIVSVPNHPGIIEISTSANNNSGASLMLKPNSIRFGDGLTELEYVFMFPTLQTATFPGMIQFGFIDSTTTYLTQEKLCIEYGFTVHGPTLYAVSANNGLQTNVDTGILPVVNQWYKLKIVVNASGTLATFYIDGVLVASISTNIPGLAVNREVSVGVFSNRIGSGVQLLRLQIDYISLRKEVVR